jgi:hypothetical protein
VGSSNFQTELQYVAEFAKHYVIGPNNVQIGIVTFANFVRNEFEMNTTKNNYSLLTGHWGSDLILCNCISFSFLYHRIVEHEL